MSSLRVTRGLWLATAMTRIGLAGPVVAGAQPSQVFFDLTDALLLG